MHATMQRAPSPYRSTSPFAPQPLDRKYTSQQNSLSGAAQVGPGASVVVSQPGPDGRMTYQPYTTVAASYQTPSGIVSGIQWIPTDPPSYVPPPGNKSIIVSGSDPSSWGISYLNSLTDWQRSEEKKRKQDEKEANRYREHDVRNNSEYEHAVRERNTHVRDRSRSFGTSTAPPASIPFPGQGPPSAYPTHPTVAANGYPTNPYSNYATPMGPLPPPTVSSVYATGYSTHNRNPSGSFSDITRQLKDMDLDRNNEYPESRSRKSSATGRAREYSASESTYERSRTISGNYSDRSSRSANANPYPPSSGEYPSVQPYGIPTKNQNKYPDPYPPTSRYIAASPNMRPSDIASSYGTANSGGYAGSDYSSAPSRTGDPTLRSTTPFVNSTQVYPRGHILEGQPIINNVIPQSRSRAPSRAPSPSSVGKPSSYPGKSPHIPPTSIPGESQQLAAPEGFSSPINAANSFTPFDMMKIEDMEDICEPPYPKMPPVLTTHDIYHEDWKRCMQDLGRSWTGQLPVPGLGKNGLPPRRSTLTADLVSLWNSSFFFPRGVELILYKGRERRTGPQAGQAAVRLPKYDDTDDSSSSSSSSSSSDSDDSSYRKRMTDPYGRPIVGQAEMQEARRRREDKLEKKRRRKEKKARRKAKAREKTYTVYIACLPGGPTAIPYNNRPGVGQGAFGSGSVNPGGYITPTYGPPNAAPAYGAPSAAPTYGVPSTNPAYGTPNVPPSYGTSTTASAYGSTNIASVYGAPNSTPAYGVPIGIPVSRSYGYGGGY